MDYELCNWVIDGAYYLMKKDYKKNDALKNNEYDKTDFKILGKNEKYK